MQDTVGLAVMVRDDARRLDRCLTSARAHVDEIVVLDTGSKDGGTEVARSHGARVYEIEWLNSFSQALNVLLGHMKTDWTLRLDSDEWLDDVEGREIQNHAADRDASAYRLVRRDLDAQGSYAEVHVLRLWRTHEKVRYSGVVHETISQSDLIAAWPGKRIVQTDAWFWHDGYVGGERQKLERNAALLKVELAKRPGDVAYEAMLATTLAVMGDLEGPKRIEALADRFVTSEDSALSTSHVAMAIGMALEAVPPKRLGEARTNRLIQIALRRFPKTPAILYFAALLRKDRGELREAFDILLKLEELADKGNYDRNLAVPRELIERQLWNALGYVAMKLGERAVMDRMQRKMSGR